MARGGAEQAPALQGGSALGFELSDEFFEDGVGFQDLEVGVLGHPVEVVVAEGDGVFEGAEGVSLAFAEGEAAREVVVGGRVFREEADEFAVHLQAVLDAAGFGVEPAEYFDDVGVSRVAAEDRFEEGDFEGGIGFFSHREAERVERSAAVFADAGLFEGVAVGVDLEALRDGREAEFGGDGVAVPFHEGGGDFEDLVAIHADDLGDLGIVVGVGEVVLQVFADIDFADERGLGHDRERAVDGGAGDGVVDGAGVIEEFFGGEVLFLAEGGFEDREALLSDAKAFFGEVGLEFFAGGFVAHVRDVRVGGGCCQESGRGGEKG